MKIAAFIFVLPFIFTFVVPHIKTEISVRITLPTTQMVSDYIISENFSGSYDLDMSKPLITYHESSKKLDLYIKVASSEFIDNLQDSSGDMSPKELADMFMNRLYLHFIDLPNNIGKITLVPETIVCYAYWDDTLLFKSYFKKDNKTYNIVKPFPDLVLVGDTQKWSLEYENKLKIDNIPLLTKPLSRIIVTLD
ncbi:hypothetical protein [Paenibacillus macquariensis]|nr:hypothetical protein [Paenibacillus macquariensis]MEC0089571.1 hypothetical protein [Paenibacillus macquariensis]